MLYLVKEHLDTGGAHNARAMPMFFSHEQYSQILKLLNKDKNNEVAANAAYLINRIPSSALNGESPFEVFYGRKPNLKHLRVIGSLSYATITGSKGDKFSPRAEATVHMGYSSTQKGYKLYSLTHKTFFC